MSELYWITRCDGILTAMILPMIILLIAAVIFFAGSLESYNEDAEKANRKRAIICGSIGIFLLIAQTFIPTTKQALIIYGVGGTIDYVKNSDTAKQLPDKAIIALDKYLESISAETEEKKE